MKDADIIARFFPFYRFGLTRNPFGTLSDDEWFAVTVPAPPVVDALERGFDHLIVLGDKGRGKSTTLHYLRRVFMLRGQSVAYERLPCWHWRYVTDTAPLDVFALDEAQRLAPWVAHRLFAERARHDLRLIIGSHRDMTLGFRLRGLDVVTVRLEQTMSRQRLAVILQRRLDAFALDDTPPGVYFTPDTVDYLWGRFRDDLRSMTFHLYDVFQRLDAPGAVTRAMVEM